MCPRPLLHDLGDEANATRETVEPSDDEFSVFVFGQGKRFSSMRLPALPEQGLRGSCRGLKPLRHPFYDAFHSIESASKRPKAS